MAPQAAIDGMFIGIDEPTHSLRMGSDRDGPLLVALGPKFNTGHDGNVAARFNDLERWVWQKSDLTAFLYQRMRDYCIGMISSRWAANGANVCGAGGL
jgi:hypothetical protein